MDFSVNGIASQFLGALQCFAVLVALAAGCDTPAPEQRTASEDTMTGDAQTTANILQLVLDLDELQQYYHVDEVPERKPLRILKNSFVENEPPLRKFGVPVVYQSQAQLQESGSAFLEFQRVDIQDDSASVLFTYPVEGVRGEVTLQHDADGWHVASHTLAET